MRPAGVSPMLTSKKTMGRSAGVDIGQDGERTSRHTGAVPPRRFFSAAMSSPRRRLAGDKVHMPSHQSAKTAALLQKPRAMSSSSSSSIWLTVAVAACLLYLLPWDKILQSLPDSLPALYKSLLSIRTPKASGISSNGLTDLVQWDEVRTLH